MLDYLHSASQGLDAATRAATDWPTFGLVDKLFGRQAQADTAAAHKQMGAWKTSRFRSTSSASNGWARTQAASKIQGEPSRQSLSKLPLTGAGDWLGWVLGSGAVGAPMSGLGEYGRSSGMDALAPTTIGKASAIGGAQHGRGTCFSGGVVGRSWTR